MGELRVSVHYGLKRKIDQRATIKSALQETTYYPAESEAGADALALLQFLWDKVEPSRALYLAIVDAWRPPGCQALIADCEENAGETLRSVVEEVAPALLEHRSVPLAGADEMAGKYETNQDVLTLLRVASEFIYLTLNNASDRKNDRARITLERSLRNSGALIGAILFKSMIDHSKIDLEQYEADRFVGEGGQRVKRAMESQPNSLNAADRRLKTKLVRRSRKWGRLHHADTKYEHAKQFYYCRVEPIEPLPEGTKSLIETYLNYWSTRKHPSIEERRLRRNIESFDFLTGYRQQLADC